MAHSGEAHRLRRIEVIEAFLLLQGLMVPADTLVFSGRDHQLEVSPPRLEAPEIRVDGVLSEAAWSQAAALTGFTQYEPVEGLPSTEDTEVRVLYSGEAIYFGIRAFDSEPEGILARLGERDRSIFGDDWIRIILDTYDDQRQGYVFYVNPLGIQTDGYWIEGMTRRRASSVSIDFNPDFIWESRGQVTEDGWTAELRIPYVSLRFPPEEIQNWGINISREVKRKGFKQSWAPLTKNISNTLAQSGRLSGLHDLEPKRLVEINPVTTGKRLGRAGTEGFSRGDLEGEAGLNARLGITQNLVLDATVNPDFSQVEADDSRVTVNERFPQFYPEKRPFFLEGAEVFQGPMALVYTRQIVDPAGGAKLTGKVGSFSVGYLGAVDESPSSLYGGEGDALFNLLRVKKDLGETSSVGLLYTDRSMTEGGDWNRVVAGDTRLVLGTQHTFTAQAAWSWTSEDGTETKPKPSFVASLARTGRVLNWDVSIQDYHPDFQARTGYLTRIGESQAIGNAGVTHYGTPGALLERASLGLRVESYFDHQAFWDGDRPYEAEVQLLPSFTFRGDRSISVILRDGYFEFPEEAYQQYEVQTPDGGSEPFVVPSALRNLKAIAVTPRLRITNQTSLNGRVYYRELPIYAEASRGLEFLIAPSLSFRPTESLFLSLNQTFARIWRRADDSVFSTAVVSRITSQYQFSRAIFARLLVQYGLEDRAPLLDPGTGRPLLVAGQVAGEREKGTIQGQFLVQYQPSPGTIFYLGYSRVMEGGYSYGLGGKDPVADGLFLKLSYLFRA
jgi:hypothetical protein